MRQEKYIPWEFGTSISVQSCFPELKSVTSSVSRWDDDASLSVECSDDDISLRDFARSSASDRETHTLLLNSKLPTYFVRSSASDRETHTLLLKSKLPTTGSSALQRQRSCPSVLFRDNPISACQPNQSDLSYIVFPEVQGHDVHTDPTLWPSKDPTPLIPGKDAVLSVKSHDITASQTRNNLRGNGGQSSVIAYVTLHLAALKGDWEVAAAFLAVNPQAIRARITRGMETALHIAAGAKNTKFVNELVKLMNPDDLTIQNMVGNTALCFAVASGITKIAQAMVNKNKQLPSIRGSKGVLPLVMAALLGHRDMVWFLYSVTEEVELTDKDRIELLIASITADIFDMAICLTQRHPELALARDGNGETALHVLAQKASAFSSGSQQRIWQRSLYSLPGTKMTHDAKVKHAQAVQLVKQLWSQVLWLDDKRMGEFLRTPSRLMFTAAELGIVEFIVILVQSHPDRIWKVDGESRSIFHVAVAHRQEKIFNLIYEIGAHKDLIAAYKDSSNTNMLHLAGKLAPLDRLEEDSGAALQLRKELHWFQEVEKIVQPSYREMKDSKGLTPRALFAQEHRELARAGEKWMKDTASSCMVVATLIATVMFAAAFTLPGGNKDDTGSPVFLHKKAFMVFVISDALALFTSATSILMFLSILTSRYALEDFLHSLPNRLVTGLATLFVSISMMMIAFVATLFVVFGHEFAWIAIPIAVVACVPVTLFAMLQFPLLADIVSHIYRSNTTFRPSNCLLD